MREGVVVVSMMIQCVSTCVCHAMQWQRAAVSVKKRKKRSEKRSESESDSDSGKADERRATRALLQHLLFPLESGSRRTSAAAAPLFSPATMSSSNSAIPAEERAPPWYLTREQIDNSPSQQYFMARHPGCTVERARSKEQEYRQATCSFLQESGQKLRL